MHFLLGQVTELTEIAIASIPASEEETIMQDAELSWST